MPLRQQSNSPQPAATVSFTPNPSWRRPSGTTVALSRLAQLRAQAFECSGSADSTLALADELLQLLSIASDLRLTDRTQIFQAAEDVLIPICSDESLPVGRCAAMLECFVLADMLSPTLFESMASRLMSPTVLAVLPHSTLGYLAAAVGTLPASLGVKHAASLSQHLTQLCATVTPAQVPAVAATLAFSLSTLSASAIRVPALFRAASPVLVAYFTSPEYASLPCMHALHQLHTVLEATDRQVLADTGLVDMLAASLHTRLRELDATLTSCKHMDGGTRTRMGWLMAATAYLLTLQGGLQRHNHCIEAACIMSVNVLDLPAAALSVDAGTLTRLYRTLLGLKLQRAEMRERTGADRYRLLATLRQRYLSLSPTTISSSQRDVCKRLTRLSQAHGWPIPQLETRTTDGLAVDILFSLSGRGGHRQGKGSPAATAVSMDAASAPDAVTRLLHHPLCKGLVVEVDGPHHFAVSISGKVGILPDQRTSTARGWSTPPQASVQAYVDELFGVGANARPHHTPSNAHTPVTLVSFLPDSEAVNHATLYHRWLCSRSGYTMVSISHAEYAGAIMAHSNRDGNEILHRKVIAAAEQALLALPAPAVTTTAQP